MNLTKKAIAFRNDYEHRYEGQCVGRDSYWQGLDDTGELATVPAWPVQPRTGVATL